MSYWNFVPSFQAEALDPYFIAQNLEESQNQTNHRFSGPAPVFLNAYQGPWKPYVDSKVGRLLGGSVWCILCCVNFSHVTETESRGE